VTLSAGRWHRLRDAQFCAGPAGWTTAEHTPGLLLSQARFHDADGNGRWTTAETVWLDADGDALLSAGEPVLSDPTAAARVGDCGHAFPDRLYAADADADGAWDPVEDVWRETAAADRADLAALHTALTDVLASYVNPLEEPAWDGGTTFARTWTTGSLIAALGQETLLSPPAVLDGSFATARRLEAWLRQAVGMVELLQLRPVSGLDLRTRQKHAFVIRGPYYELNCSWQESSPSGTDPVSREVLTALWRPPYSPATMGLERPFSLLTYRGPEGGTVLGRAVPDVSPPEAQYFFGPWSDGYSPGAFAHTAGPSGKPWYLGSYSYTMTVTPSPAGPGGRYTGSASVTVASPSRSAFGIYHSGARSVAGYPLLTILPSSTTVASLFATEWAAAEWYTASSGGWGTGAIQSTRWESDTSAYWPDGHDTAIYQSWQETAAILNQPAGVGVEIYVNISLKQGTPDLFAGKDVGRYWHWSTLPAGSGGLIEVPFVPAGFPTVPNPVYPGGDYEAATNLRFTIHGIFDHRGAPGFAPLPAPPGVTIPPPGSVVGAYDPDSNRDDLVDTGVDLASFGPDTGTLALQPEWTHPQVLIPLAVALWNELPVQAFLSQGAATDGPNREWLHPDAGAQPLAFSLHTRAMVEELLISPTIHSKIVTVVRPRGNRVAFEFAWDAAAGAFAALGFPLAPNDRRTYVLCDLTPADDRDASFELHFDSGLVHVYAGGSLAEGALTQVRHLDGRSVAINSLNQYAFEVKANTFASPRCRGTLTWSGGFLRRLDYTWYGGGGTLGVELAYASTPAGAWVTSLTKTIPELSVRHTGTFGFGAGAQALTFGSGVTVTRNGDSLTTVWPSGGALTEITTCNADGLPTRLETLANGSAHATDYRYAAGGSARYPANGAPGWSKLVAITHPDGAWERFEYDPTNGWLTAHISPFGDAAPTDPDALCRVRRYAYDSALSAGAPADPALLDERPRRVVTETLGVETERTYHAYRIDGPRSVLTRRCAAVGADWGDPENLESHVFFHPQAPASVTTPSGWVQRILAWRTDDRLTLFEAGSSGQTVYRVVDALGHEISYRCTEPSRDRPYGTVTTLFDMLFFYFDPDPGLPLATAEVHSTVDPFGRPVRTDTLDGTCELFNDLQWHGGPLRHTLSDGSVETCSYFPDGRLHSRTHYGVTTSFAYDALGNVVQEQRRAGALAVQTRSQYDSQGRQTLFEDELGRRTVTLYRGRDRTVILPDGSRRVEEAFLDGTPRHLSGNAVAEQKSSFGVAAEGTWSCLQRRTPAGFTDVSYVHRDRLGRTWQTARSRGGAAPQTMSTTGFDPQGRPCRSVDADGVTTLTEYDVHGEVSRTALDLDGDGQIGAADRITTHEREVLIATDPRRGDEVTGTLRTVSSASGAVSESFTAADGWRSWSRRNGRLTYSTTALGAGPGQRTVTTTFPDGSARIETYAEGLLRRVSRRDAAGAEIAAEDYAYDALRRLVSTTDAHTGVATSLDRDAAGQVTRSLRSDAPTAAAEADYDALGRTTRVRQPGGGEVFTDYDPAGRIICSRGADTLPRRFEYDPRGPCNGMRTYQGGLDGSGDVLTEWLYDERSGRLAERRIDGTPVETYRYSAAGRLEQLVRHLPGGAVGTTYSRDGAGEVTSVAHADGSAGASIRRDRSGRPVAISDASGTRDLDWDRDDHLVAATLPQVPGAVLRATYDPAGRRTALTLSRHGTDVLTWTWAYDPAGRLASVSDGSANARYEYLPGAASLVARTVVAVAGSERLSIAREWDSQNRLTAIRARTRGLSESTVAAWEYSLDADGRRLAVDLLLADPADATTPVACRWDYAYDPLGQLSAAVCRDRAGGAIVACRDYAYDHDSIANRRRAGRRDPLTASGAEGYTVNDLNQYTVRSLPGAVYIAGMADPEATVTVNGELAERAGAAFQVCLPVDNRSGPVTLALAIRAVRRDDTGSTAKGLDLIASADGSVRVPAATELLAVAGQGGLAADSLYTYEWDLNDRLLAITPTGVTPQDSRLTFTYDSQGRRIAKQAFQFVVPPAGGPGSWVLSSETRFVWDLPAMPAPGAPPQALQAGDWTLLAEFDVPLAGGDPTLTRSYLWGLDLAGMRTGTPTDEAGGIGGLLAATSYSPSSSSSALPVPSSTLLTVADGNGSIAALIDAGPAAEPGQVLETVEYDPFGTVLARRRAGAGPLPAQAEPLCPFGFSSKYVDSDSGLVYFGYRYYRPDLGRWLCRDPLQEQGGPNLYAYCQNDPINHLDPLGLALYAFDGTWNDRDEMAADPEANPTNVAALAGLYEDPFRAHYLPGPGTDPHWKLWRSPKWLGGGLGKGTKDIVDDMYGIFRDQYQTDKEIIIVGFSRGAAEARAFANRIYGEAVARGEPIPQIQFMGLFDTVRMTAGLEQAVPPNVKYVAHATARNERRRAFPLTRLYLRDPNSSVNCVEKGFYGTHSDVGGGWGDNWISNAVLLWMWAQMQKAEVTTVRRPSANITADFERYTRYEDSIFKWYETLAGSYDYEPPWHDSSWFIDRLLPRRDRGIVSE
jgi:RHS repeat-associated protein